MDWRRVDERLIRRGELLLSPDFLEGYDYELSLLNDGKVGRPFKITDRYIVVFSQQCLSRSDGATMQATEAKRGISKSSSEGF